MSSPAEKIDLSALNGNANHIEYGKFNDKLISLLEDPVHGPRLRSYLEDNKIRRVPFNAVFEGKTIPSKSEALEVETEE